jgi:HEAT repeat protein
MKVLKIAELFVCRTIWQTTGIQAAGRVLVDSLGSSDDNVRVIAGMFLVQAGKRAEPLLQDALQRRQNLPMVLSLLGDIGSEKFEPDLLKLTSDHDPRVAQAAENALRVLATHH